MPLDLNLYRKLCTAADSIEVDIDPSISTFFENKNISGQDLLNNLIEYFAAEEDKFLQQWLWNLKEIYFSTESLYEDDIPAFGQALSGVLSLYIQKKSGKDIPIDIPNMIPESDFMCLIGTIRRMSDVRESILGLPEKQFMNAFFTREARNLVEIGMVRQGNEVHTPVTLCYLLGFLTHPKANEIDYLYCSALKKISPQEVFRIRREFYKQLPEYIKKDMNERLEKIQLHIFAVTTEEIEELNELARDFKNKYDKDYFNFVVLDEEKYIINTKALDTYIKNTYPTHEFAGYDQLIEATPNTLTALPLLEKLLTLRILRDTGDSGTFGNNALLQNAIIASIPESQDADLHELLRFGYKKIQQFKLLLPEKLSLDKLIIYGASFTRILQESNQTLSSLDITHIKSIVHAIATRENGAEIYNAIIDKVPADKKIVVENNLLSSAILNNNEKLIDKLLYKDDFNHKILLALAPDSYSPLFLIINFKNKYFKKLLNKIDGLQKNQRSKILNYVDENGYTLLHIAVLSGNDKVLEALLAKKEINVNQATQKDGYTPLHLAALSGNAKAVETLLAIKEIDVNQYDEYGNTPLHLAVLSDNAKAVEALLAKKEIYVNQTNLEDGYTPLHLAVLSGNDKVLEALLAKKEINVNQYDEYGNTPLHLAVLSCNTKAVEALLAKKEINVNQADKDGNTPLHIATRKGNIEALRALLAAQKIKVNQTDKNGNTPLHIAARKGNIEALRALLATDVTQAEKRGSKPCGRIELIKLFIESGTDVNKDTLPVISQCFQNDEAVVKILKQKIALQELFDKNLPEEYQGSVLVSFETKENGDLYQLIKPMPDRKDSFVKLITASDCSVYENNFVKKLREIVKKEKIIDSDKGKSVAFKMTSEELLKSLSQGFLKRISRATIVQKRA